LSEKYGIGREYFVDKGIISDVRRLEFVTDSISCSVPRDLCCDNIDVNSHGPTEIAVNELWSVHFMSFLSTAYTIFEEGIDGKVG
jgi:hypothetical protein